MAELTLEQKRAIALAAARQRVAGAGAQPEEPTNYLKMAGDLASYANPAAKLGTSFVESLIKDATSDEKTDARDNTMGKIDSAVRGAADTMAFGFADELAAGGDTLVNGDSYAKNLERQRATDTADSENRFQQRLGGQLAGGVTQGIGLAKNGLSLTANAINKANAANKSVPFLKMMGLGSLEGWGLGTLQGLGSGTDTSDRLEKAAWGGALGTVLGGGIPAAVTGGKALFDRASAFVAPEAAKERIMAALLRKSGLTAEQLAARLQGAQDDGQNMFMSADALELPGQRIMSTAARTPNEGRKAVVDALQGRQMDQGRRVAADLTDASGSPLTAEQYQQMLRAQRSEDAARNYAPVEVDQTAIDVSPAVDRANKAISPVADNLANVRGDVPTDLASRAPIEAQEAAIRDPIRQALKEARSYLASDSLTVTNVEKAFRAKTNIDAMISKATENGQGAMVDALMPIQQQLDEALARTSPQYASARDAYSTASQRVDAVDTGRELAKGRNRVEDTLSTFGALPDEEAQQAARVGYFDPKIADAASTKGKLPDVARKFTSNSMRQELPALAVPAKADQLMRRLGRENTMTDTAQAALGGSKTADNNADFMDSAIDPGVLTALASGRFKDAALSALTQTTSAAKGMPPSVVEKLIPALMETNPEVAQQLFSASAKKMSAVDQARAKVIAALIGSGSTVPARIAP